jgi:hypothetical protein
MLKRLAVVAFLSVLLSGCILQSREPLFDDADGSLLLKDYGTRFASYTFTGAEWKKEDDTITFTAEQHHYIAGDGKSEVPVTFVQLGGDWWVMQGVEVGKPTAYLLAQARMGEVLFYPLTCKSLQEAGGFEDTVSFEGDDCFIRDGTDVLALFATLAASPGKPSTKLVPIS